MPLTGPQCRALLHVSTVLNGMPLIGRCRKCSLNFLFSDEKGYGFITPEDGSKDLFIHHTNILGDGFKSICEGQAVTYEAVEGRKGPEATNVQPQ
jgi:CspA family cold shock protein